MRADVAMRPMDFSSSFLSCEKDTETILKKLFIESAPYSNQLKRLLVINTKDCIDDRDSQVYKDVVNQATLSMLRKKGYIRLEPKLKMDEHDDVKSYIYLNFDSFTRNSTNPQFRDCTICFDIMCHSDYWDLGNYRSRPLKIAGYIDGILNKAKLSGIGLLYFLGCNQMVLDENISGYSLMYRAIHWTDDKDQMKSQSPLFT